MLHQGYPVLVWQGHRQGRLGVVVGFQGQDVLVYCAPLGALRDRICSIPTSCLALSTHAAVEAAHGLWCG